MLATFLKEAVQNYQQSKAMLLLMLGFFHFSFSSRLMKRRIESQHT